MSVVLQVFEEACDKNNKLFLPDTRDASIIESMMSFYNKNYSIDLLCQTVEYFVAHWDEEVVRVYDFALVQSKYRERVEEAQADKNEIDSLMKRTREQMESFK